jgi:hypothetical protein
MARRAATPARNLWLATGLVGLLAAVVLWLAIGPLDRVTGDTDSAASVLYFERIVHGQRLEAFVPTTPKPLLTVVYGLLWSATADWRAPTLATIGAGSLAVALAARLAGRLAGMGASAVIVVGLLAWPDFREEVANANSFVWALALWLLAGLLMTADRPRPWPAGAVLLLAGLARTETIWILAAIAACVVVVGLRALRGGDRSALHTAWPLLLGALFVPVSCLHDWLLTGRPLYWLSVPSGYTALEAPGQASIPPLTTIEGQAAYYTPAAALVCLAVAGLLWLILSRRLALAFVLVSLVGGVLLALIYLAWKAVLLDPRYYQEADAPILLLAAVGTAASVTWVVEHVIGGGPARQCGRRLAAAAAATVLALGVVVVDVPHEPLEPQLAGPVAGYSALEPQIPTLRTILAGAAGGVVDVAGVDYPVADPRSCRVFVPRPFVPLISVETGAPVDALGDSFLAFRRGEYGVLHPGQYVLHIAAVDGRGGVYAPFEHSGGTVLAVAPGRTVLISPVYENVEGGVWLVRIDSESGAGAGLPRGRYPARTSIIGPVTTTSPSSSVGGAPSRPGRLIL